MQNSKDVIISACVMCGILGVIIFAYAISHIVISVSVK